MNQIALDKNGNFLSYTQFGDQHGFPILIQHGLIASITDTALFDRLIRLGARLICAARPGYGASSPLAMKNIGGWADIVSILIDELRLPKFDVLGMSSGAPYSYAIGNKFPDKVRNIYIFSGTPALYDEKVLSCWPYEVNKNASIADLEKLAHELFFSNLTPEDLSKNDIKDSMMNNCFGIAQDFKLRCMDWGFNLSDVKEHVDMRHSRWDQSVPLLTAEMTSKMLSDCKLEIKENDVHFSKEALDDFIENAISVHYER